MVLHFISVSGYHLLGQDLGEMKQNPIFVESYTVGASLFCTMR